MNPAHGKLRKPAPTRAQTAAAAAVQQQRSPIIPSMHWLFRSNIPRRRTSYIAPDINKRNFFGMGEIIGVLTNVKFLSTLFGVTLNTHFAVFFCFWAASRDSTIANRIKEAARGSTARAP